MESKNQGRTWPFFRVLGKVLGYFGSTLAEFWGYFILFYAISSYFTLFYAILRNFTLIFDSMISNLTDDPVFLGCYKEWQTEGKTERGYR